jgi:DNA relaxase NicK
MSRTFCDYYAFRTRGDHLSVIESLRLGVGGNGGLLGHEIQPSGWHGYASHSLLNYGGMQAGLMAWGGKQQLGWVFASLSGAGCRFIESWDFFEAVTQALPEFAYRRVDLALDVPDGTCSHDRTVAAFRAGSFFTGGQRPRGDRIEPEDRAHGCTFYVGNRRGWKFFRGYDKGCEIRAKSGMPGLTHIGGTRVEDLYRLEVEFKAVDGVALPLDLVRERDRYFAGAYPYLGEVLQGIEGRRFALHRRYTVHADLTRSLAMCQRMFGPTLLAALRAHGGNQDFVWQQIVGKRISNRLISRGALIDATSL